MAPRLNLQAILESILGSRNVYFQPPPTQLIKYPCIVYKRDNRDIKHADNRPYIDKKRYMVTVIDPNPDSLIPDNLVNTLPMCAFDRFYTADNLNHDVHQLFF